LYSSFAYILVALILTLVTGWEKWGAAEYSAVAGSPVLIYGVRTALDAYYNYRIANSQGHLNELYKQRESAIEKLKAATKYNSTQQLLEKYGGSPPSKRQPSPKPRKSGGGSSKQITPQGGRTGFAPPPTANIPGRQPPPMTPEGTPNSAPPMPMVQRQTDASLPSEEFAPNAFSAPSRPPTVRQASSQYATDSPKWYDRILDVVLGEDETQAKNRIVLICQSCRLVNGQAPPGTRTLEEVGRWRCSSCNAMNGVEAPESKMLKQIAGQPTSPTSPDTPSSAMKSHGSPTEDDSADYEHIDEEVEMDGENGAEQAVDGAADAPPARSTRSQARQKGTA